MHRKLSKYISEQADLQCVSLILLSSVLALDETDVDVDVDADDGNEGDASACDTWLMIKGIQWLQVLICNRNLSQIILDKKSDNFLMCCPKW